MSSFAPSSLLLVTAKLDSADPLEQLDDLRHALANGKLGHASLVEFPQFKVSDPPLLVPLHLLARGSVQGRSPCTHAHYSSDDQHALQHPAAPAPAVSGPHSR